MLEHTRAQLPEGKYDALHLKTISGEKANRGKGPTKNLTGDNCDPLDFCTQPSFDILRKYYGLAERCEAVTSEKLVEYCDAALAP